MKGNDQLINALNQLLADELTAINQYMVHSEMCDNWGYEKLHKAIEQQAIDEMRHAEWLIGHILSREGLPIVSQLNTLRIGRNVPDMVTNDVEAELGAIRAYNAAIRLAREIDDQVTAELLIKILKMENDHEGWNEQQRDQIAQLGLENYLSRQLA
jgi:bacterioferritin